MKHLEDEIMKVCEGSTFAESVYAMIETICRKVCLTFYSKNDHPDWVFEELGEELASLQDLIKNQMNDRFNNELDDLKEKCFKTSH